MLHQIPVRGLLIALRGNLVSVRGVLIADGKIAVRLGRRLISIRARLVGVRPALIGRGQILVVRKLLETKQVLRVRPAVFAEGPPFPGLLLRHCSPIPRLPSSVARRQVA